MIHRTGYLMTDGTKEKYIQIETALIFFREKYINSGKHNLFKNNHFLGHITINDNGFSIKGMKSLTIGEIRSLVHFLKRYTPPIQESCPSSFGFGMQVNGNISYCEVFVKDHIYHVWFDGMHAAKLNQNENMNWIQLQPKLLEAGMLQEISNRIEQHYNTFD